MPLILNIDTATEFASVCLSNNNNVLMLVSNSEQKNHASFLQPAIKQIFNTTNISFNQLDAIAVSNGPGSYTGLRVGLSSAKGLCFALNKPLVLLNTLEIMANGAIEEYKNQNKNISNTFFCPMIDARRMDVFTALYNSSLQTIIPPNAVTLNHSFAQAHIQSNTIVFFGSGSSKGVSVVCHANAIFSTYQHTATAMVTLANNKYNKKLFANLAYCEPFYLKEFYTPAKT